MSAIPAFFPKPFHKFVGNPRLFGFLEPYEAQYPVLKTLNNVYNAAPASKWGLSIVPLYGVFVGTPPVEKIDLNTSGSLCATGSVWSVYALMIQPQNAGSRALCAVNAAMAMVNGYNCYRKLSAPASPAAMENTTADRKHRSWQAMNRNDRATVYIGALSADVDEDLLFELAVQFGPVRRLVMPKDKLTGVREDFAFVEFANQADAEYMAAVAAVSPIELFGKKIRVSYKGDDQLAADALLEIGAKLCVRNVDPAVDESAVAEHFKQFGNFAVPPKLLRNDHGLSRGIAFISYDSFESSDAALSATNNSWLFNRVITVAYAEKPDGSGQHGSDEERALYRDTKAQLTGEGETAGNAPNAADAAAIASVAAATGTGGPSWAQGLNPYAR